MKAMKEIIKRYFKLLPFQTGSTPRGCYEVYDLDGDIWVTCFCGNGEWLSTDKHFGEDPEAHIIEHLLTGEHK